MRRALGAFTTGVTVVTARSANDQPVAMTVSSFAGVSLEPPLVLWSAQRSIWPFEVFNAAGHFAVHVLHAGQADLAMHFARDIEDKFSGIAHTSGVADLPLLDDFAARFQCRVEQRIDGGDHVISLGRVVDLESRSAEPLVYQDGRMGRFTPA